MVAPQKSDIAQESPWRFLLQISDRLVDESAVSGIALHLALLILNMMKRSLNLVFSPIPTLKELLTIKNGGQIKDALTQLEHLGYIKFKETKTKKRKTTYYYHTLPPLRSSPFFSLYSDFVAPTREGKKCPGPIMSLSKNELRLLLWLHRAYSRIQITGSCYLDAATGHGLMTFDSNRCNNELGFRNFSRLLDALQDAGFIINDGVADDGSKKIKLANPFIKDGVKCIPVFQKKATATTRYEPVDQGSKPPLSASKIPASSLKNPASYGYDGAFSLLMTPDPAIEQDLLARSRDFGFTQDHQRGFRKLLKRYGPFLVEKAIKASSFQGEPVTFSEIRRHAEELASNSIMEFHDSRWEIDNSDEVNDVDWREKDFDD